MELEGGADAEHDGVDPAPVLVDPEFLLRTPQRHPDEGGAGRVDPRHDGVRLLARERAERRRQRAGDPQTREARRQALREPVEALGRAAVEEDRLACLRGARARAPHQVGAVDALLAGKPLPPQVPGDRRAVRGDEVGAPDRGREGLVAPGRHDAVHVAQEDRPALAAGRPVVDLVQGVGPGHDVDRDPQHVAAQALARAVPQRFHRNLPCPVRPPGERHDAVFVVIAQVRPLSTRAAGSGVSCGEKTP